ncbi:YccF domain-containing protein [Saccharicrinis aurantiacus]|uniref:YccF domain-containing protein n=1 Tax=Saccharicrinis aurantiacus TaxID=1849719 RepID=UPI00249071AE|nr:YccF domain-containing protein [Saccharicrinis aurantiacus]
MRTLGNIIWFVFGGIFIAIEYILASIPLFISIIGIPFGLQTLKLAGVALWPFGKRITDSPNNSGCLSFFMNILWLITGGFGICLSHLLMALLFSITIIGIPFGKQHFKLAGLALTPFGRIISEK